MIRYSSSYLFLPEISGRFTQNGNFENIVPEKHVVYFCCVVVTMEVEVTSLQGMMGILRNSCIRKKDGGEVSYSGCDAKNRNDSY